MEEQQHNIIGLGIFYSPFTLSHSLCLAGWHGTAMVEYSQLVGQFDVYIYKGAGRTWRKACNFFSMPVGH